MRSAVADAAFDYVKHGGGGPKARAQKIAQALIAAGYDVGQDKLG